MVLICFVLDLSSFQPSLLRELKQCLLQLANFYAIRKADERAETRSYNPIGLCCIQKNNLSGSNELRVAYHPKGTFNLREFHHAVNSLCADHFIPRAKAFECSQIYDQVSCLGTLLTSEGLYSWGPETISRKIIMISGFFMESVASFRKTVTDAADHCVTIEFIQIESEVQPNAQWGNFTETILSEKTKEFTNSISELENCLFRRVQPDYWSFWTLFKRWLQDIKDELEEPLQAVLIFKDNVVKCTNKIFCQLFPSIMQIADQFRPCQKIAAAEEFLPVPDAFEAMDTSVSEELIASINSSLAKMGFHDYNPLHHERGYHTKLNWLVKESLQFRSMPMPMPKSVGELNSEIYSHKAEQGRPPEDNVVTEVHDRMKMSPSQFAKKQIPSILERMDPLRTFNKLNTSLSPPNFESANQPKHYSQNAEALSAFQTSKSFTATKKPLVPFPQSQLPSPSSSPRLKPNFRRIKRTKN